MNIIVNRLLIPELEHQLKRYDISFKRHGNNFEFTPATHDDSFVIGRLYQISLDNYNKEHGEATVAQEKPIL